MTKIKVTAQQRRNALDALYEMWPSVPPKNVVNNLNTWRDDTVEAENPASCNTIACFGGWCAEWPNFVAQGVIKSAIGAPRLKRYPNAWSCDVAEVLFGDRTLFDGRDLRETGTDHQVVTKRLQNLIRNSVVTK